MNFDLVIADCKLSVEELQLKNDLCRAFAWKYHYSEDSALHFLFVDMKSKSFNRKRSLGNARSGHFVCEVSFGIPISGIGVWEIPFEILRMECCCERLLWNSRFAKPSLGDCRLAKLLLGSCIWVRAFGILGAVSHSGSSQKFCETICKQLCLGNLVCRALTKHIVGNVSGRLFWKLPWLMVLNSSCLLQLLIVFDDTINYESLLL